MNVIYIFILWVYDCLSLCKARVGLVYFRVTTFKTVTIVSGKHWVECII